MLRVRPVHFTSMLDEFTTILTAIGLECTENYGNWRLFDSGHGKIGLHHAEATSAEHGTNNLGFEIRDHEIFVSRTLESGTQAELFKSGHGMTARVSTPDGYTFLADPVSSDKTTPDETVPAGLTKPTPWTVVQQWHTPDPTATAKVLADIGARPIPSQHSEYALFQTKNGGLVEVHPSVETGVELCLEYSSPDDKNELTDLATKLSNAAISFENAGDRLLIHAPDGSTLTVRTANSPATS